MKQVLLFVWLTLKAVLAVPSASGDTTAYFGGDAHFSCKLQDPSGVQQVTWQRLHKDKSVENLATYSKRFGRQINDPYHGKVAFTEASVGSTSITVKNLTWADDACYICSFSVYPSGSKTRQTCLTVQGISEVEKYAYQIPNSGEQLVSVHCSATGKPAPHIQWNTSAEAYSEEQSNSTVNADGTFTTNSSLLLRVKPGVGQLVECVLNGGQRRQAISINTGSGEARTKEEQASRGEETHKWWIAIIAVVVVTACVSGMFFYRWKFKRSQNDIGLGHNKGRLSGLCLHQIKRELI